MQELGVPVVALSQLSRQVEQRDDHKPQCRFERSGSIEQDADVVMLFLGRDIIYKEKNQEKRLWNMLNGKLK